MRRELPAGAGDTSTRPIMNLRRWLNACRGAGKGEFVAGRPRCVGDAHVCLAVGIGDHRERYSLTASTSSRPSVMAGPEIRVVQCRKQVVAPGVKALEPRRDISADATPHFLTAWTQTSIENRPSWVSSSRVVNSSHASPARNAIVVRTFP
jgi:hypothetical protein